MDTSNFLCVIYALTHVYKGVTFKNTLVSRHGHKGVTSKIPPSDTCSQIQVQHQKVVIEIYCELPKSSQSLKEMAEARSLSAWLTISVLQPNSPS